MVAEMSMCHAVGKAEHTSLLANSRTAGRGYRSHSVALHVVALRAVVVAVAVALRTLATRPSTRSQ